MIRERRTLYVVGFLAALALGASIAAYNLYVAFGFGAIPPGRMSPLSFIGLKDLQRGQFSSVAIKPQAMLAYVFQGAGLSDFVSLELAAIAFFAAIPVVGGLFARLATKSLLVGAAASVLLSILPFGYISAIGGDYSFISAIALTFATLCPALLFLRVGGIHWLGLSVGLALLAGVSALSASLMLLVTCMAWAVLSLLSGQSFVKARVTLPGFAAVAPNLIITSGGFEETSRQLSLASALPQYAGLLGLVGFAGLVGSVALAKKERWDSVPLLAFVGSGLVLLPLFGWEALLLVAPSAALLVAQPLTEARRLATVTKGGSPVGAEHVVELDLARVIAVAVALLTLSSPFVLGLGPGLPIQGKNYLGPEELNALHQIQSLSPSEFGDGLVAAPSSIAPWLRAESGVNTLLPLTAYQSDEFDAITSTSFRIKSSYLMADDWTPLSFVRSPLVYAFDGLVYAPVLHLDDGQNRVNLTYGKAALSQYMAKMFLFGHKFAQNSDNISLTLQLANLAYNATKVVSLSKDSPVLSISYAVTPNQGDTLLSLTLPVFIEGEQQIRSTLTGNTIHLTTSGSNLSLSFPGGSPPKLVHGLQDYVSSTFDANGGSISASVTVTVESAKNSGQGELSASLLEDVAKYGISSLLTFTPPPGLNFLSKSVVRPVPSIDIKDAFNQVLLTSGHTNFTEAPSYATVLSQNITDACDASFTYKTAGLTIQKSISKSGDALSLAYQVSPWKANTTIRSMNVTLWIPQDSTVVNYHSNSSSTILMLDSGTVGLSSTRGHLLSTEIGPDQVYGQNRVLFRFSLNGSGDSVGILIKFGGALTCQQTLSSRPLMNGSDELVLSVNHGLFDQVYSNETFTVYRLAQGNHNAAP
ncbi:MAG: hypothetical protein OK452_10020 [Thaumarchaeota archaeon]|nr:hypothetical protein [Nitrososphaerota archaeon]